MFHDSPERAKVVPARLDHHNEEPAAQPSEPTLFPKLRTYIADFPFLPDSYGPEAANLGDLVRL